MQFMNGNHDDNNNEMIPEHIYQIFKDNRITNTQKYFFVSILALDDQQGHPEKLELPIRSLKRFGIKGHGHIKSNLEALKFAGYLLEVGRLQRADGYPVTCVVINRQYMCMFPREKQDKEDEEPEGVA